MDRNEILSELQLIFRDILEDDEIILREDMSTADLAGWDSLSHISIIENTERKFNIKFSIGEIVVLKNIGDLINLIQEKITQ